MGTPRTPYKTIADLENAIALLDSAIEAAHIVQLRARSRGSIPDLQETERIIRKLIGAQSVLIAWRQKGGATP